MKVTDDERIEWLAGEIRKALQYLDQVPQRKPVKGKAEGNPEYAAGLHDMAEWLLETVENDISYHAMRSMLEGAIPDDALPKFSSELTFTERPPAKSKG